jgi:hypothetical protein
VRHLITTCLQSPPWRVLSRRGHPVNARDDFSISKTEDEDDVVLSTQYSALSTQYSVLNLSPPLFPGGQMGFDDFPIKFNSQSRFVR